MSPPEQGREPRNQHPAGDADHERDALQQIRPIPHQHQDEPDADDVAELWRDIGEAGA
jgi:hypothetical protein